MDLSASDHQLQDGGENIFICPLLKANLLDLVAWCKLSFEELKTYCKDALVGLSYFYSLGMCHLDIKGDNILVGDNIPMICDSYSQPTIVHESQNAITPDGQVYDLWGFGIMMPELYAPLSSGVQGAGNWRMYVYPVLTEVLQDDEF